MTELFLVGLALSVGLVAAVTLSARVTKRGWAAPLAAGAAVFLSCGFFSLTFALQSLLTLAWSGLCSACGWRPRAHFVGASVAAAIAMGLAAQAALAVSRRVDQLRAEFPVQSLAPRLAYELRPDRPPAAVVAVGSPQHAAMGSGLAAIEERRNDYGRGATLRQLHGRSSEEFRAAMGFGFGRIPHLSRYYLELPEREPERMECPADVPSRGAPENSGESKSQPPAVAPETDALRTMHLGGATWLFDQSLMGYVAGNQQAAGFESHRLLRVPRLPTETWQVVRLELVSLLKYDRPQVYASTELPRMDALADMPRRELVEFEAAALERLRQGEDVVFEAAGNRIAMLGSLRAARDCLDCHTAQRGELLGALSYELLPAAVVAEESP